MVWKPTAVCAAVHFAVDLGCAYAVFSQATIGSAGFLLYNFCAFALQMPLGIVADQWNRNTLLAALGTFLVALMVCVPTFGLWGCAVLGIGNSLFHLGGGLEILNRSGRQASPLGVFVSPGALGLYCGTLMGKSGFPALAVCLLLLLAVVGLLVIRPVRLQTDNVPLAFPPRRILPAAAALFVVVALRSFGGMAAALPWKTGDWSLYSVLAVVLGKTMGGIAADRWGFSNISGISLLAAAVLFCFGTNPWCGLAALFLFNMTMPITLFALSLRMPGCKGFSFGLLTFALFLGFLPSYLGFGSLGGFSMAVVCLVSAGLLLPFVGRRQP